MKSLFALALVLLPSFGMAETDLVSANSLQDNVVVFAKRGIELTVGELKSWMTQEYKAEVRIISLEDTLYNYLPGIAVDSRQVVNFEISKDSQTHEVSCYLDIYLGGTSSITIWKCESEDVLVRSIYVTLNKVTKVPVF